MPKKTKDELLEEFYALRRQAMNLPAEEFIDWLEDVIQDCEIEKESIERQEEEEEDEG